MRAIPSLGIESLFNNPTWCIVLLFLFIEIGLAFGLPVGVAESNKTARSIRVVSAVLMGMVSVHARLTLVSPDYFMHAARAGSLLMSIYTVEIGVVRNIVLFVALELLI